MSNELKLKSFSRNVQYFVQKKVLLRGDHYKNGKIQSVVDGNVAVFYKDESSVRVQKSNLLFDGRRFLKNPVNQCFAKASEVMDDLCFSLSKEGSFLFLENRDAVLRKWTNTKLYLERFFVCDDPLVSDRMSGYIESFDSAISDESLFVSAIKRDLFYYVFFRGYYRDYGKEGVLSVSSRCDGLLGGVVATLSENWQFSKEDGQHCVRMKGCLDRDESEQEGFSNYWGIGSDPKDLRINLEGESFFDDCGIPIRMNLKLEAMVSPKNSKQIVVSIKRK